MQSWVECGGTKIIHKASSFSYIENKSISGNTKDVTFWMGKPSKFGLGKEVFREVTFELNFER